MICPNCKHESSGNFCSNCGAPLGRDNDENLSEDFCTFDDFEEEWQDYEEEEQPFPEMENISDQRNRRDISENEYAGNGAAEERSTDSSMEENRKSRQKTEKSGKEKESAGRSSNAKDSGKEKREQKKEQRREQKEQKEQKKEQRIEQKAEQKDRRKREERMKTLENEVEQLRGSQDDASQKRYRRPSGEYGQDMEYEEGGKYESRSKRSGRNAEFYRNSERDIRDRSRPDSSGNDFPAGNHSSSGNDFGEAVAKGAVGIVVLLSRLMQLASAILMACMVLAMAQSFWVNGQNLGDIRLLGTERNYGLAIYVSFAGVTLFMGLIWCLWILSRKGAGGGVRMKKYDTGRGFLPFLICIAAILATGLAASRIPIEPEAFRGAGNGIKAALEAVNMQWEILLFGSTAGAVLSLIRKIMRV